MEGGKKDIVQIMRDAQKDDNMGGKIFNNDVLSFSNSFNNNL